MPPFEQTLEPVALPGEAVRVVPDDDVYQVVAVEQVAKIGPVDYGSATAGNDAQENNSNIIDLDDELEGNDNTIGQYWINPISQVEIEVRQQQQQEQRFTNANQVGVITPNTPSNQRVVYVFEQEAPFVIITNPQTWDMAQTLVYYTGYVLHIDPQPMGRGDVESMRGEPATIPVDSLKRAALGGRR